MFLNHLNPLCCALLGKEGRLGFPLPLCAGHLADKVMQHFEVEQKVSRKVVNSKHWSGEAVIEEVAEQKVGGPERLAQAVRRGAVRVIRRGLQAKMHVSPASKRACGTHTLP